MNLFHVHNDIENAAKHYKIPMSMYDLSSVYILQQDRCVFVGSSQCANIFLRLNENKYCKSIFPNKK